MPKGNFHLNESASIEADFCEFFKETGSCIFGRLCRKRHTSLFGRSNIIVIKNTNFRKDESYDLGSHVENLGEKGELSHHFRHSGHNVLRGLPAGAVKRDTYEFFTPLKPDAGKYEHDSSGSLSADASFPTHDDAVKAMAKDKEMFSKKSLVPYEIDSDSEPDAQPDVKKPQDHVMSNLSGAERPNNSSQDKISQFKLVLLGESQVGKSSLVLRFVKDEFHEYQESIIDAAFTTQTVCFDGTAVKFEICDNSGMKDYRKNFSAAIVVYDITNQNSFKRAKTWIKELQYKGIIIALAGNKADLGAKRAVEHKDVQKYANDNSLIFMETSAKTAMNVKDMLHSIAFSLKENACFETFYKNVYAEAAKHGQIVDMQIANNRAEHLSNNIYIEFNRSKDAQYAQKELHKRCFRGQLMDAELTGMSGIHNFRCNYGRNCIRDSKSNCCYLHFYELSFELKKLLKGK